MNKRWEHVTRAGGDLCQIHLPMGRRTIVFGVWTNTERSWNGYKLYHCRERFIRQYFLSLLGLVWQSERGKQEFRFIERGFRSLNPIQKCCWYPAVRKPVGVWSQNFQCSHFISIFFNHYSLKISSKFVKVVVKVQIIGNLVCTSVMDKDRGNCIQNCFWEKYVQQKALYFAKKLHIQICIWTHWFSTL